MLSRTIAGYTIAIAIVSACAVRTYALERSDADKTYWNHCASCHGQAMEGGQFGPALKGDSFSKKWLTGEAKLLDYIEHSMPPANPGQLSHEQYRELVTLIESASRKPSVEGPSESEQSAEGVMNQLRRSRLGVEPAAEEVFHDDRFRAEQQRRSNLLSRLTPVEEATLRSPPKEDWISWRGGNALQSFSRLDRITKENVSSLVTAWAWSLPVGPNEIEPLVRDGVMFVNSTNEVQALDAESGDLLWRYRRKIPEQYQGSISGIHRNMALYGNNLYVATNDRHVVALDTKTGKVVWDQSIIPDSQPTVVLSSGPIVANGKIVQSSSGGPGCTSGCEIVGLDAATGKELWRFNSIARAGAPGGNSWNGLPAEKRSGGGVWIAGSYDPVRNLVFYGIGQTYKIEPLLVRSVDRRATSDALYTDSTVALNPDTGRLEWFHQHQQRDLWDLDEAFERMRVTLPGKGGQAHEALVEVGKSGILDALDPSNGRYLFSIDLGLQNFVNSIDPNTGVRNIPRSLDPKPGVPQLICPSLRGARNWMTTAYDPDHSIIYLPLEESCMQITWSPNSNDMPFDIGWSFAPRPGSDGNYGRLQAINLATRTPLWTNRYRTPIASSLLATKGGLVFVGNRDRTFQALDSQSGNSLWQTRLNAVPSASPVTYEVNGKQYVAIVTGGGGPQDSSADEITPEVQTSAPATTLWVFKLPEGRRSVAH